MAGYAAKDANGNAVESAGIGPFTNVLLGPGNLIALAQALVDVTGQNILGIDASGAAKVDQKRPGTVAHSNPAASASDAVILAANANRIKATFFNNSAATLYIRRGAAASSADCSIALAGGAYWVDDYTGAFHGVWASASGSCGVDDLSA